MKKIHNRFVDIPEYNCYGCAPGNPAGLKLEFYDDEGVFYSKWTPDNNFSGYKDTVHGGVQSAIIDETSAWAVDYYHGFTVVTVNLNVTYHKPLNISSGNILTRVKINAVSRKTVEVYAEILKPDGSAATSGVVLFRIVPERAAKRLLNSNS